MQLTNSTALIRTTVMFGKLFLFKALFQLPFWEKATTSVCKPIIYLINGELCSIQKHFFFIVIRIRMSLMFPKPVSHHLHSLTKIKK